MMRCSKRSHGHGLDHIVTLHNVLPILAVCDTCARIQGKFGFWGKGAGQGHGIWENGRKVLHGIFLFFETELPVHIVITCI